MRPLFLTGLSAISTLGVGLDATLGALRAQHSGLRLCDFADVRLQGYIGRVPGVEEHELPPEFSRFDCRNNRLADMALRANGFDECVAAARERHGAGRIAVVLGTSTAGILSSEEAYRARDPATGVVPPDFDYVHTHDMFSLARYVRGALGLRGPALTLSTACASSSRSFLDAWHLIASGVCDAAVVGGADSLCRMTLYGFAALGLISPEPCRPCDVERNGISIGEAAGFALLERNDVGGTGIALLGCGASSDGYHMSTPDPQGKGAIGAMRQALADAGLPPSAIDYINLHGTGTRSNDAMEDSAVSAVFGTSTPCSSTKGWSGHTLGASGILEAAIASLCLRHGLMPGCLGVSRLDPSFNSHIVTRNERTVLKRVMSNSFGFGGVNCSLIFGLSAETMV